MEDGQGEGVREKEKWWHQIDVDRQNFYSGTTEAACKYSEVSKQVNKSLSPAVNSEKDISASQNNVE